MRRLYSEETARRFARTAICTSASRCCALLFGVSIVGPALVAHDPLEIDFGQTLQPPSLVHPFGTDDLGRDVLARVAAAGRVDMQVVAVCVLLPFLIGSTIGLVSGYFGGWVDLSDHAASSIFSGPFPSTCW